MAELIVKIKMPEAVLQQFWKDTIKQAKREGVLLEQRDTVELEFEQFEHDPEIIDIWEHLMASVAVGTLQHQVNETFKR